MPLERAIADFRFAYSSRQTETQMAPPPRVPLLTDFPQYVAEGFEAAFGRATFSRRPTAANWVSLIQKLEGELQQCSATTAHHHVKGKRCPFCYMEQATPGFLAFVSGTQNPLPLHVDIKSLIAQLNSIADPGVPPSLQSVVSSPRDLRPSAAATDVIFSVKRHLWIALATSISAVFLMQFGPPMTILGLFLSCAGLIVSFKPPAGLARIGSARTQAENAWRTVQEAWSRQESNKRFIELKTEAQTVVRLLQELPQEEQRGLQHLERKKRENQLRRHLEKFNIASARIRKIGSGRKVVLASHGIETAADIDEHHLQSVPGFGPTLTSELLTWRRTLEGRFAFNPREPLNPADISTLRGALAKRKVEAENRLRGAVLNLQNTAAYARDLRSSLSRSAQHAFTGTSKNSSFTRPVRI